MGRPLDSVLAKIDRAKEHSEELKTLVEDFKAATTRGVVFSFDAASGKHVADVRVPNSRTVTPSAIFIDRRGSKFVGSRAYNNAARSPETTPRCFSIGIIVVVSTW